MPKPGNWLGFVAVLCFVLAAGFIIKLSIESGWLTPARQIGVALLLGSGLIATGLRLLKTDREYASLLPGAGIIIFYVSIFAAHSYYALIPFETALVATSAISGICIYLYTRIRHDVYPITAALGAYVSPFVLGFNAEAAFSLYYFLLCSAAFAIVSLRVESRMLTLVAAYSAILMTALIGSGLRADAIVASMLVLHFLIFSTSAYAHTRKTGIPLSETEAWSFFPILLLFYAAEYHFISRIYPSLAPWLSLSFAGILIGFYVTAQKTRTTQLHSYPVILAYTTVVCFHSIYLELLPLLLHPWLFPVILSGLALFPKNVSQPDRRAYRIPLFAVSAILLIEYLRILSHLLDQTGMSWLPVAMVSLTSIWLTLIRPNSSFLPQQENACALLGGAHLLAVVDLYRLTFDYGSLAVSASWLLYASAVIVFAFNRKDDIMAKSALFVLAFATAKALLYDAASAPTLIRIFCLLLTGAVLYACGLLMRRMAAWHIPSSTLNPPYTS